MVESLMLMRRPSIDSMPSHSEIILFLDSSKRNATSYLTNGIFHRFSQLISWTKFFFSKLVVKNCNRISHVTRYFSLSCAHLENKAVKR